MNTISSFLHFEILGTLLVLRALCFEDAVELLAKPVAWAVQIQEHRSSVFIEEFSVDLLLRLHVNDGTLRELLVDIVSVKDP